jgi:L-threonylcarbamoyladenylate synthase
MMPPPIVSADPAAIAHAAAQLRQGRLVAFPTETVYGLGADATNDRAVAAVYAAKGRPQFNPLIVHGADADALEQIVTFEPRARCLAARFWPGPLTLVLPRRTDCPVSLLAGAGLDTLAVRVPAHEVARALIHALGGPLVGPSANRSGRVSPTTAAHVAEAFDAAAVALVLDGGPCRIGVESTVLDLSQKQAMLLRPGGVTVEAIIETIGPIERTATTEPGTEQGEVSRRSPGMLASHYAPRLPVRLNARTARPNEALLAFGPDAPAGAAVTLNLSPAGDTTEAAANLFAMLRRLDRPGLDGIAVMAVPETGLGLAINDRLRRAAAPRTRPGAGPGAGL